MLVSLIAAVAENGVIGRGLEIPWRLPDDFKHFRRTTMGHHVIMGRKTWSTLPRALEGRPNLVLSRKRGFEAEGAEVFPDLKAALAYAHTAGEEEAFVIGGAGIYAEALPMADRIYLTRVHAEVDGDVLFPDISEVWVERSREPHEADDKHAHAFSICVLEREK